MSQRPVSYFSQVTVSGRKSGAYLSLLFVLAILATSTSTFAQRTKPTDPSAASAPADKGRGEKGDKAAGDKGGGEKGPGGKGGGRRRGGGGGGDAAGGDDAKTETAYDFHLIGPDGKDVALSQYKDKYLVVVNLGRKSSYNDQLAALIKLNDTYKDKGLVVIGVPSNEFGAAEPGTQAEILKAYADAKVDFPIMGVSKLTGDDELPFYTFLTKGKGAPAGGDVAWNYTKFVVDKKGAVVARLDPDVAPDSPEMLATIDQILDGSYKPKKEPGGGGKGGADAMKEAN
ncbi:glutathione peroxidase [Granulicella paludicola]|uniref:glutathione peroxidase n=1 Tax=Granulicella paludicola TaxID=474951 RepID=UPI0021E0B105|nr:glutathione peroxidase [Granulicella paludicola]